MAAFPGRSGAERIRAWLNDDAILFARGKRTEIALRAVPV